MPKTKNAELWEPVLGGTKFIPPKWAKYASRQPDGTWYWYEYPPILHLEGHHEEHGWYASDGRSTPVLKNAPVDWMDSLNTNPLLLGSSEDERKSRILQNASARYMAALGKLVIIHGDHLVGITEQDSITWAKLLNTALFEIIETPEDEFLRYKDGKTAPYWRALPCEPFTWRISTFKRPTVIDRNIGQESYVLIRPPREAVDGTTPPWNESSFRLGSDLIIEPSSVEDDRVPFHRKRHPDIHYDHSYDNKLGWDHICISKINWD